jgi:hypothetical protein
VNSIRSIESVLVYFCVGFTGGALAQLGLGRTIEIDMAVYVAAALAGGRALGLLVGHMSAKANEGVNG